MRARPSDLDAHVRRRAFEFLDDLSQRHGDALPRAELIRGFEFDGRRVPLMSAQQGIFKPAILDEPLSVLTAPVKPGRPRPYDDSIGSDGIIFYRYRGTDPRHRDNEGLRAAMRNGTPLIYFYGLPPGLYAAAWPAFIVGDDPKALTFTLNVDDRRLLGIQRGDVSEPSASARREYITRATQYRLHQTAFREHVLRAYQQHCAVCRLGDGELLDAAHILPDTHERGDPVVANGLALCKIHHAAFDRNFFGIRPDTVIEVRQGILDESDGPMLTHGLQELHRQRLVVVPKSARLRPDPDRLAERFEEFRRAG